MEDWKKKYEELFGHVQDFHKRFSDQCSIKKEIEDCIPELAESEDERIRKSLIKSFTNQHSANFPTVDGFTREQIIAYLEKQKEQKPLSTEETELNSIAFLEQLGYTCIPPGAEQKPTNSEKPKEWSEEDEQFLLVCKNALQKYQSSDKWDANIIYSWLEKRLKSLRTQTHWKPSDEQIKALKYCVNGWQDTANGVLESLYNDLQKLI